jgi:small multidrug resistance family-3 protein
MRSVILFVLAGTLEIGGGYLVWLWLREHRPVVLGVLGFLILALYGLIPVFQPPEHPFGRVYAAYGAVFIILSVVWGWGVDRHAPDLRDCLGTFICLIGATIMMWPRFPAQH